MKREKKPKAMPKQEASRPCSMQVHVGLRSLRKPFMALLGEGIQSEEAQSQMTTSPLHSPLASSSSCRPRRERRDRGRRGEDRKDGKDGKDGRKAPALRESLSPHKISAVLDPRDIFVVGSKSFR